MTPMRTKAGIATAAKAAILSASIVAVVLACSAPAGAVIRTPNVSPSTNLSLSIGQVYQDASPFNTPVPANPQLAPNSRRSFTG